jgi:hypothetical protein
MIGPDRNAGKEWPEMDLFDLANSVRLKNPIEEVATFLCRSRCAMCVRMAALTLREAEAIIPICAIEERPCGP